MNIRASSLRPLWLALGILVATLPGRVAQAQSPQELFQKAVFLISRARFDESVEHLGRARAATKDAALLGRIHLYLGINHSILGHPAKSDEAFRTALRHNPDLKLDPKRIKASIVKRFNTIRASRGELKVDADVQGAKVFLDGKEVGTTPYQVKLPAGQVQVRIHDPEGGQSHEQQVTLASGDAAQVTARLAPDAPPRVAPPAGRKRIWTWVAAGTAAVSLGVAIGLGLSAKSDNKTYEDLPDNAADEGAELESSGRAKYISSAVLFGVAGAAAVTSVVLFFMEGKGGERKAAGARLHVVPGPSPGVVFATSF